MKISRRKLLGTLVGIGGIAATSAFIYHYMGNVDQKVPRMLPPGQNEVNELVVLNEGPVPQFDEKIWSFQVYGMVQNQMSLNYAQFLKLPRVQSISDFHCVTGWSKLDNRWEGVRFRTIVEMAKVSADAKFATIECENSYTTSLPLEDLTRDDVLLSYRLDDKELPPEHGGPLRIVVPEKYGYKSAKWVRKIKFTKEQELGFWETRGYSNTADPNKEERYSYS
jgi:DMSO/TMAO reductase YedYZ molybdopterin-dependent catalytic subunit